jgi:hypothetical protein
VPAVFKVRSIVVGDSGLATIAELHGGVRSAALRDEVSPTDLRCR